MNIFSRDFLHKAMKTMVLFAAVVMVIVSLVPVARGAEITEAKFGFSYRLPTGWIARVVWDADFAGMPLRTDGKPVTPQEVPRKVFGGKEGGPLGEITFNLSRDQKPDTAVEKDLALFFSLYCSSVKARGFGIVGRSDFQTETGVRGFSRVVDVTRMDGLLERWSFYYLDNRDGTRAVATCKATAAGSEYDALFDSIIKTFRFTKVQAQPSPQSPVQMQTPTPSRAGTGLQMQSPSTSRPRSGLQMQAQPPR